MNVVLDWRDDLMSNDEFDWGDEASTFGDRLARAREHAGMDQAALARRLGVKLVTVRNWETDRSEPRANRLQMVSGLLGISIIWLLTGDGEGGPSSDSAQPATPENFAGLLTELRELRLAQTRLADRAGRIEKRLRELAAVD